MSDLEQHMPADDRKTLVFGSPQAVSCMTATSRRVASTSRSLLFLMACWAIFSGPLRAEQQAFTDSPFWQNSIGWWSSTNTYFDGDLNYRIREYHSLVHITSDGTELIETEYKFYPPGDSANAYGAGKINDGEGIEVIISTRWQVVSESMARLISNAPAFGPQSEMETQILTQDTAVRRVKDPANDSERYRMLITLHDTNRRNIAHYGLAPEKDSGLAGFALFRGRKISAGSVPQAHLSLRELHRVAATLSADHEMKPDVQRLDTTLPQKD